MRHYCTRQRLQFLNFWRVSQQAAEGDAAAEAGPGGEGHDQTPFAKRVVNTFKGVDNFHLDNKLSSSSVLPSSLELSDTNVYEP